MSSPQKRRIIVKMKSPNPLFEKWITEWKDKATENDSKMQYCFSTALQSLRKFPLPLETGKDCKILKGFGEKLCDMLDKKLKVHLKKNGRIDEHSAEVIKFDKDTTSETISGTKNVADLSVNLGNSYKERISESSKSQINRRSGQDYIPQLGSGSYAILVTLFEKSMEPNFEGYLTKLEIIRNGQHLSDTSFAKPQPDTRYTAWSSMKTLITKKLVQKAGNPAKFSLTDEGAILATRLYFSKNSQPSSSSCSPIKSFAEKCDIMKNSYGNENNKVTVSESNLSQEIQTFSSKTMKSVKIFERLPKTGREINPESLTTKLVKSNGNSLSRTNSAQSKASDSQEECVLFAPNEFNIILYVDTQETCGKKTNVLDDPLLAELQHLAVPHEVKQLKVGDYGWICRHKTNNCELILPYIIERKRMDDFASSIKDGRYHEQKFRLKRCGIKHITYLIESYGKNDHHVGLPLKTLYQAATNTAMQDGFTVKFSKNLRNTAEYLSYFTTLLTSIFTGKTLVSCPKDDVPEFSTTDEFVSLMHFKEFNSSSVKNKRMRVKDLFVKMLIQIKGMSVDRALVIVDKYQTPLMLHKAYKGVSASEGEKLLAPLTFGNSKKAIGLVLSKIVFQFFTLKSF